MAVSGPFFNFSSVKREDIFDYDALRSLNTYRNWGSFGAPIQKIEDKDGDKELTNKSIKSLFNPVYSVGYNQFMQVRQNAPILDMPETREEASMGKDCSIKSLVEASQKNMLGRSVYSYADFMYCKHLGKLSNNYLVTLRRFPFPAGDHINYSDPFVHNDKTYKETEKHNPDIGRLVTWMGTPGNDMSKILSWSIQMPFKEMKSGIEDAGDSGGDGGGVLGTFLNATTNSTYRNQMVKGYAGGATFGYMSRITGPAGKIFSAGSNPPYAGNMGFQDHNKVYGPVDVIASTHIRDVGLNFTHDIELVFDYELRSYDGINGKAAFLDLLGNILAVTYANGAFWGGAYRGTGASQSNVFANLPIYKLDGNSSFSDVVSAFTNSGQQIISSLGGNTGDILKSAENIISTLAKGAFSALLGAGLNAMGRPQKHGVASLLSPMPVGFWHLTVGNPWNPIMTIGNLILDGATIEQYGPLGLDDFPTGLKVTVKLKHGKPRDAAQIEHMFMQGENRIYTPANSEVLEMYRTADPITSFRINLENKLKEEAREKERKLTNSAIKAVEQAQKDPFKLYAFTKNIKRKTSIIEIDEDTLFDEEPSPIPTLSSDDQLKLDLDKVSKYFYQWFGTKDKEVITAVSKEAAFGSKYTGKDVTGRMS